MSPTSQSVWLDTRRQGRFTALSVQTCTEGLISILKEAVMTPVAPARSTPRRLSPRALFEALATPHGVDRCLELVNPMLTVRDMRAKVTEVARSSADTVTLTLRPTRQWRGFQAGQFVTVTVEVDGVRRTRCYSPVCSQHRDDGRIELTIKARPDGCLLYTSPSPR